MQPIPVGRSMATVVFATVVALATASIWLALRPPVIALGLGSPAEIVLFVATGLGLAAGGSVALVAYPGERFGPLVVAAAVTWFVSSWTSPGIGVGALFTAGLLVAPATPALVGHAIVGYGGSLGHAARAVVIAGYAVTLGLLGMAPLLLGMWGAGCPDCPLLGPGLFDAPALGEAAARVGLATLAAWSGAVVVLVGIRTRRASGPARRTILPVLLPGAIAIVTYGLQAVWSMPSGWIGVTGPDAVAWVIEAVALVVMSGGAVFRVLRRTRTRNAIAAMVLDLVSGTEAGRLQERLRTHLGDATLVLAYPVGDGRLVTAAGQATALATRPGRHATPLVRDGEVIAMVEHRAGLEEDADRMAGIATAAGLALDHERLLAVSRSRLADVRASRARVVDATDRERAGLERDLHDGAQQRLAGLALAIRMVRASVAMAGLERDAPGSVASAGSGDGGTGAGDGGAGALLAEAEAEVRASIDDVRDVAHGIYPAVLADLGLGAALASLAERSTIPFRVEEVPGDRFAPALESTAYVVVAQLPERMGASRARVRARVVDGSLRLDLALDGVESGRPGDLTEMEDRVGALDGTISIRRTGQTARVEVELPCAS